MVDDSTRRNNAQIILDVLDAKGGDGRFLRAIAGRESGLNHAIRHRMKADTRGSIKAWQRNERLFADNPWYHQQELWDHGKGLFGMMPAYHLHRWDPLAHPDSIFNPYVASVIAARLTASAMRNGAETWADVDQTWATGRPRRTDSWGPRRDRMIARLRRLGYPEGLVDSRPSPGEWGRAPQPDQLDVLWQVAGDDGFELVDDQEEFIDDQNDAPFEVFDDDMGDPGDLEFPPTRSKTPILAGTAVAAAAGLTWFALRTP